MEAIIFKPVIKVIEAKIRKGILRGNLYGFRTPNASVVLSSNKRSKRYDKVGVWDSTNDEEMIISPDRIYLYINDVTECFYDNSGWLEKINFSFFDYEDLFARNFDIYKGIPVKEKKVVMIGCGSVGSSAAVQLAKSGIQKFSLVDPDVVSLSNVARQEYDLQDVGNLKVNALKNILLRRNPSARIEAFPMDVLKASPKQMDRIFRNKDLVIVSTDSIKANTLTTYEVVRRQIPSVYLACYERAQSGEVIFYIPGVTPCYMCAVGFRAKHSDPIEKLKNQVLDYSVVDDITRLMAEPGLALNIDYITNLGLMFALALLLGGKSLHYRTLIKPLLPDQNIIFVNAGSEPHMMFNQPFEVVYGKIKTKTCPVCQAEAFEESLINEKDINLGYYLEANIEKEEQENEI